MLLVTSASGEVEAGYEPDAYGNLAFATDKNGTPLTTRPDIFYTGKDFDDTTGLYYFNARWYDPETGRFLSRAAFTNDVEHPYVLCENDPIGYVDPTGMLPLLMCEVHLFAKPHPLIGRPNIPGSSLPKNFKWGDPIPKGFSKPKTPNELYPKNWTAT